ncbi:MAG: 50S ribosomal protein L6 [Bacilli bacterium]|nr:50S ribosomal protein L6 [Bacilli bacterium]
MSRIGKRVLTIPEKVNVKLENNILTVSGPLGELSLEIYKTLKINIEGNELTVEKTKDDKFSNQMHGTTNANINNMLIGVSEGFKKGLEIVGVGYRFAVSGNTLTVQAGYSHPVKLEIPAGIKVNAPSATELEVSGADKIVVGEFAANIRKIRQPEPYKGKGIHYKGEHVRRKEGKKAAK